ncbi:MAG: Gfo/Idh/MocA family oxidoreductase [Opitutaceae bacterium]|nr:Gfo/Idh/MocA family oxidoreductase [Opitutaceae bacterium]
MKKLRGAIIGCGFISEFHLRGWSEIPEVEICALVDPVEAAARDRCERFAPNARLYCGMESMLAREEIDFVDILTPPWMHREQCLRAAEADLHILCQKPLCDRWEDARQLVDDLRNYPRRFVVHDNHRFRPWFRDIARRATRGDLGRLRHLELVQHDPSEPPEKIDTEVERGVLLQYGVHLVDMAVALLGDPIRVHAHMDRINPRVRGESLAQVRLEYEQASAIIDVSWKCVGVQQGYALVIGEAGEAFYEGRMTRADSARFRVCSGNEVILDEIRSPRQDYVHSFQQFEREFVDSVLFDSPPPQPAHENLRSLRATFAAYEAARTRTPVTLESFGNA